MLFNSSQFVFFFLATFGAFLIIPKKRWLVLLIASYIFYMSWRWDYIVLIITSTLVDYFCARGITISHRQNFKKVFLFISILTNLSILFFFKYYTFFIQDVLALDPGETWQFNVILPVGISFYTFQTMSYTLDVYHGKVSVEKHLGRFALFVTYFPQLVAGPIERAGNLLHQLRDKLKFKEGNLVPAAKLFLFGLFKKIVIADRIAVVVDHAFASPSAYDALTLVFASFLFAVQIYCDFSGYSDMAIGLSRAFNVHLMKNFNAPYLATGISDFWRRWHISLSTWFRDYVYIPLGGNRVVKWRWYYNLLITFLLSGIWHGANWTFIVWGLYHGLLLTIETIIPKFKIPSIFKALFTFFLVTLGWIMFRAENVSDALIVYKSLVSFSLDLSGFRNELISSGLSKLDLLVALFSMCLLFVKDLGIKLKYTWVSWVFYLTILFMVIIFAKGDAKSFIYFQF